MDAVARFKDLEALAGMFRSGEKFINKENVDVACAKSLLVWTDL